MTHSDREMAETYTSMADIKANAKATQTLINDVAQSIKDAKTKKANLLRNEHKYNSQVATIERTYRDSWGGQREYEDLHEDMEIAEKRYLSSEKRKALAENKQTLTRLVSEFERLERKMHKIKTEWSKELLLIKNL